MLKFPPMHDVNFLVSKCVRFQASKGPTRVRMAWQP